MDKVPSAGINKTGVDMAPRLSKDMKKFALNESPQDHDPSGINYLEFRRQYIQEEDNLGSIPIAGTFKSSASGDKKQMKDENFEMLIDKLGERLAFERSGVRLYEAFILKCENSPEDLPIERLMQIRDEEHAHFLMLTRVMKDLGADPTSQTPCADVVAVASMGLIQVLNDPRTDVIQGLNALLTAELTDNAGWELLIELAKQTQLKNYVSDFELAQIAEEEHVLTIQDLLRTLVTRAL